MHFGKRITIISFTDGRQIMGVDAFEIEQGNPIIKNTIAEGDYMSRSKVLIYMILKRSSLLMLCLSNTWHKQLQEQQQLIQLH